MELSTDSGSATAVQQWENHQNHLHLLVENVRDYAFLMLDAQGQIATWNKGAERLTGYTVPEITGKHFAVLHTPADIQQGKPADELKEAEETGRYEGEGWRVRNNGAQFWAGAVLAALHDEHDKLLGYTYILRDLTDRKRADDELRLFRMLVENVQDYAIYLLDLDGHVTTWNKGAERIKGFRAKEVIGQHFSIFLTPEDVNAGKAQHELGIAADTGRFEEESWRVRKDGSRFWANVVITALRDPNGKLVGFAKITRDLSEPKALEEELRAARHSLEQRVDERTAELERANQSLQLQLTARKQAEEAIRALSTPVLPVRERLLILPIIGIIDSQRALQLTEELLGAIRTHRAKAVVIDITGVPIVDSKVANHLLQTVDAARLMGATVIVTGISPEISQTLVRIGVDLSRLRAMGDLRGGLEEAEQLLGYALVSTTPRPAAARQP